MKGWQHVISLKAHCETAPTSHTSKYTLPLSLEEESGLSEINAVTDLLFSVWMDTDFSEEIWLILH